MTDWLVSLNDWGTQFLLALQQMRTPVLTAIFRFITNLHGDNFYLFKMCIRDSCWTASPRRASGGTARRRRRGRVRSAIWIDSTQRLPQAHVFLDLRLMNQVVTGDSADQRGH